VQITQEEKEGLHLHCTLQNGSKGDILELPYFFYLGYEAILQTETEVYQVPLKESIAGFLEIELPKDIQEATITIDYKGTIVEKVSYAVSGIGAIGYIAYGSIKRRRNHKHEAIEEHTHSAL